MGTCRSLDYFKTCGQIVSEQQDSIPLPAQYEIRGITCIELELRGKAKPIQLQFQYKSHQAATKRQAQMGMVISIPFSLPLLFEYRLSYSECNKNPACLQINSVISKSFGWSHQSRRNPMGKANVCSWLSLTTMGAIKHRISDAKSGIMLHSVIGRHRYQTPYFIEYHSCFQGLTSFAGTQQRLTCSKFVEGIY